jgi:glucosamine 6-phosphate synthetase-like amidotransferase/phosphosugar isomerase protein
MCGIAGYSFSASSRSDRTLAAQTLLSAIAERGSDAAGYAYRGPDVPLAVHKQQTGARGLLDRISVPNEATQALVHVRDYTKGHPTLEANNHPIRHGTVVGIHNGIVANDEEIFARHGFERADDGMSVDSEAIFALVEEHGSRGAVLEELYGSMASAWLDARIPDVVFVARGMGRPLWIGASSEEFFFASTGEALELVERYVGVRLRKREVPEGTLLAAARGRVVRSESFRPDRSFSEQLLPSVRAPEERVSCLARLAVIAAPAGAR